MSHKIIALSVPLHSVGRVAAISRKCRPNGEGRQREGENGRERSRTERREQAQTTVSVCEAKAGEKRRSDGAREQKMFASDGLARYIKEKELITQGRT